MQLDGKLVAITGSGRGIGRAMALAFAKKRANLALIDLTVHGWDLAEGTGQPYTPSPEVVAAIGPFTEQMAPTGREMGAFAEMTDFPPDADDFVRLLAHTGRKAA